MKVRRGFIIAAVVAPWLLLVLQSWISYEEEHQRFEDLRTLLSSMRRKSETEVKVTPVPVAGTLSPMDLCPRSWNTPLGVFWAAEPTSQPVAQTVEEQLNSIYEVKPVNIRPQDIVLDLGAYIGTFTRVALNHGARLVVAVEPNPASAACLRKTFDKEIAEHRVQVVEAAIWESRGQLHFTKSGIRFQVDSRSRVAPGKDDVIDGPVIRALSIDELVESLKLPRVDFIKMDIEGSERYALKGARGALTRFHPRIASAIYHPEQIGENPDWVVIPHLILSAEPAYRVVTIRRRDNEEALFYVPEPEAKSAKP